VCGIAPGAIGDTEGFKRLKIDDAVISNLILIFIK
jgi:hypothetical protein